MTTFKAGRFRAECGTGPARGGGTTIKQSHLNGSDEIVGQIELRLEDLQDFEYVLKRAIAAHQEKTR